MWKTIVAVTVALAMLLCATGCNSEPVEFQDAAIDSEILTYEDLLEMLGVQEKPQTSNSDLSFEMVYKLGNNDELNAFVQGVSTGQPVSYTRRVAQEGYEASLTVYYNVTAVSIELLETYNGETYVQTFDDVSLSLPYFYEFYTTEDGQIDSNSYMMAVYQAGLYGWYSVNPSIFTQCVHYLIATLPSGDQLLVDYYYNETLSEQLELLYASQG